jgi:hypothetical protein
MTRVQAADVDWLHHEAPRQGDLAPSASWELRVHLSGMRAVEAMLVGDLADAHRRALDLLTSAGSELNTMHAAGGLLLALARDMGGLADLLPAIEAIVESNPRIPAFGAALAAARAIVGDEAGARTQLEHLAVAGFDRVPRDHVYLLYLGLLAECVAQLDDPEHADAVLDLLEPYAGQMCVGAHGFVVLNAMDSYRGMVAAVTGDPRGRRWFEAGLAVEERLHAGLLRARTAAWFAAYLRRHGAGAADDDRAAELLASARQVAEARPDRAGLLALVDRLDR